MNFELNALIRKKNELDNLKSQYKIINKKFSSLKKEKSIIIELISGTSNLDTLIAKLGPEFLLMLDKSPPIGTPNLYPKS